MEDLKLNSEQIDRIIYTLYNLYAKQNGLKVIIEEKQ